MYTYAVVIPTFNEKDNVEITTDRLEKALVGLDWEVIFVDDDSQDGTLEQLFALARKKSNVRFIRRIGRRGLSSACVEGMLATAAPYIAIMDADLQHDAQKLPQLFELLSSGEATVAVCTRYVSGGGIGEWDKGRALMSKMATWLSERLLLAPCTDPMSGFFAIRRECIDKAASDIAASGFKILFDLLTNPRIPLKVKEVPYTFSPRVNGETKLDTGVMVDFAWLFLKKICGKLPFLNFLMFGIVGSFGVAVHLCVLFILYKTLGYSFIFSNCFAILAAMTSNYILNNKVTFANQILRGFSYIKGCFKFYLICIFGAFVNISIAQFCYGKGVPWWLSSLAGIAGGSISNYFISKTYIWKKN